jgi:NhaP-type Na+/H+ or K+/H+ antiporter
LIEHGILALTLVLAAGIAAQWLAWRLRVPAILVLLAFGFAAGPGTRLLDPDALFGELLFPLVSLSVGVILFEGGLSLKLAELRAIGRPLLGLVTVGALVTWVVSAAAAHYVVGIEPRLAWLLGAILVVTGPTVIGPLLRHVRPRRRVGSVLKWEGIVIDPIGAVLAVLVFGAIGTSGADEAATLVLSGIVGTLLTGVVAGVAAAGALVLLMRRFWVPGFLEGPVALALALGSFTAANLLRREAGLVAVTVMGIVLANQKAVAVKPIVELKENLRVMLLASLFIVLAARVDLRDLAAIGPIRSLAFLGVLIGLARPAAVALGTIGSGLDARERVFLAWVAPRGIVAAAVASVFALDLAEAGLAEARLLAPLTFLVILGTAVFYGLSAAPVGRWLGLTEGRPQGALVVGADAPARALAAALQENGFRVALVDTNREHVLAARLGGLNAHHGSIVSEDIKDELDLAGIGRLIALTPNDEVNALAALHFRDVFDRAEVYQLWPRAEEKGRRGALAGHLRGRVLFGPRVTHDSLEARIAGGAVVKTTTFTDSFGIDAYRAHYGDSALPMFVVTETGALAVVTAEDQPRPRRGQKLMSLVTPRPAAATPEPSPGSEPAVSPPA